MGAMTIPSSILQRCMPFERYIIIKILFQKWRTDRQGEKEPPFLFSTSKTIRLCVPASANPKWRPKSPHRSSTTCYLFWNMHTKAKYMVWRGGGGREDIQETCPKETSKGQWSTTKRISSICFVQQDVANAFSLTLRGEQEKGCTWGKIP